MMANLKANKLLALFLCLGMVVGLLPAVAFAEESTAAEEVQKMIDALPDADTITAENCEYVTTLLEVIDDAKSLLIDDEQNTLNLTKYNAATEALNKLNEPMLIGDGNEYGSLIVNNIVTGEGADTSQEFNVTIELFDGDERNDVIRMRLKGGESLTINGITAGSTYKVTATAVDHYTTTSTGATGTIVAGGTSIAEFTNTYVSNEFSFTIEKTVAQTGDIAPGETTFHFVVATTWNNPTSDQILARPTITLTGTGTGSTSVTVRTTSDHVYIYEANDGANGWSYSDNLYKILKSNVLYSYYCDPSTGEAMGYYNDEAFSFTNQYNKSVEKGGVTIQKSVTGNLAPEENGEAVDYCFSLKLLDEDDDAVAGEVSHQKNGGSKMSQEISTAGFGFSLKKMKASPLATFPPVQR